MNRPAAKEKTRSSGPSRSYPETRVRASRLLAAAHILAIVELSRRLHQACEHAYGKQAAEWLLPQKPSVGSDPDPITSPAGQDCNISVSLTKDTFFQDNPSYPNGPSSYKDGGANGYGLGFTVTVSDLSGGVGNFGGGKNGIKNPDGAWTVEQLVQDKIISNGVVTVDDHGKSRRDSLWLAPHKIEGNKASWWDQPGVAHHGNGGYFRQTSFRIVATNGIKSCEADFNFTMSRQRGWVIHWGQNP
jgi:hypothetical protein